MITQAPESRREADALREHDEQKMRHERTIEEHERHPQDGVAYHHMKETKEPFDAKIGFDEKAERRQEDVDDSALKEEANTYFRNEEGI